MVIKYKDNYKSWILCSNIYHYCATDSFRDGKMENFCKFVQNMDHNVRGMLAVAYDNRKKHVGRKYIHSLVGSVQDKCSV